MLSWLEHEKKLQNLWARMILMNTRNVILCQSNIFVRSFNLIR